MIYGLTAHWWHVTNVDTMAAAWPAWDLVHHHTLFLEGDRTLPSIAWFFHSGGHLVTNRMAGVVLISVPAQVLMAPFGASPLAPAILTAVLLTSCAMANCLLLLLRAGADRRLALAATTALALGTGFWTNAGAELWTHGPDAFWLTTAMLALQRDRLLLAGLAMAPAMWTRPHLAVAAAAVGLAVAWGKRSLAPLLAIGLPTGLALVGLEFYNAWYYGARSLGGGYAGHELSATATTASSARATLESAAGSLISPLHGLLVYSPFVALALVAAVRGWSASPSWARGSAAGGLLYLMLQWRLDGFTGGTGLYSYRLPLEMLVLAAPLAAAGYAQWAASSFRVRSAMRGLIGASVGIHVIGVFWYQPLGQQGQNLDAWRTWEPWYAAQSRGPFGTALACLIVVSIIVFALVPLVSWARLRRRLNEVLPSSPLGRDITATAPS